MAERNRLLSHSLADLQETQCDASVTDPLTHLLKTATLLGLPAGQGLFLSHLPKECTGTCRSQHDTANVQLLQLPGLSH